jgi:hypothetical protein
MDRIDVARGDLEVLDALPAIVWIATRDGRVGWFNRKWYEYAGDRQFAAVVHPLDLESMRRALHDHADRDNAAFELELRLRRADGVNRWFRTHVCRFSSIAGEWLAVCTDIDDHKRQGQRFALIAQAGETLAESLDLQTTLERLLAIIVPEFGDWAAIDLFDENGRLKTAAAIAADPRRTSLVKRLVGSYNHNPDMEPVIAAALRKNRPLVLRNVTDEMIAKAAAPELLPVVRALEPRSTVTVPLRTRAGTVGSLVAYWAETPRTYSKEDLPLFEEFTRRAAVAIENARLYEREREVATEFQRAALPISLPKIAGVRFDAVYVPACDRDLFGGDWYDALRLNDGRIVISIGDVAGSGLSAAVIMASMRQVIRGVAHVNADPIAMLDAADETLKTERPETFVTAFVGVLDPAAGTLTYASAGHPSPLLRAADGSITMLTGGALPLGLRTRAQTPVSVTLPGSAFLVFYTDGLIEAGRDIIAGHERLLAAVARRDVVDSPNPAGALYQAVLGGSSSDDVVILTVTMLDRPR